MSDDRRRVDASRVASIGVVLGAFALRVSHFTHGLPRTETNEDWVGLFALLDRAQGSHALGPLTRGAHTALLHLEYLLLFLLAKLRGLAPDHATFGAGLVEDPSPFLALARFSTAVLGALTVLLLVRHARIHRGATIGLLAGVFLAASFGHVELSRRVTPDAMLVLIAFWSLTWIADGAARWRPLKPGSVGVLGAAAARAGWTGILLLAPYGFGAIRTHGRRRLLSRASLLPVGAAAMIAGLLAVIPSPPGEGGTAIGLPETAGIGAALGAAELLVHALGPGLLALAAFGIAVSIRQKRTAEQTHIAYLAAILVGQMAGLVRVQETVVALPSLCLLAASGARDLVRWTGAVRRYRMAILAGLAGVVSAEPLLDVGQLLRRDAAVDTRMLAADWILENVAEGSRIEMLQDPQRPWLPQVRIPDLRTNMNKRLALVQREAPRAQHHWEAAIRSEPPRRYNIVFPDDEPVDLAEGDGEGVGSSPGAVFAVVDPAAAEPAGDAIATFLPEWPRTKGPPLEIRLLTPGE